MANDITPAGASTEKKTPITPPRTRQAETPATIKVFGSPYVKRGNFTYLQDGLRIKPNTLSKDSSITVDTSEDGKTMHINFRGDGWDINADSAREFQIYQKNEYGDQIYKKGKTTPPERLVVTIEGNRNRFHGTPIGTDITVNGDNNIIQTGDNDDNITINGFSNIVAAYDGNDNINIEQGSGNSVYLGDGDDKYKAPKDGIANHFFSGDSGHDSGENGTYIKNKNLTKNNFDAMWQKTKQKTTDIQKSVTERARTAYGVAKDGVSLVAGVSKKAAEYNPWLDKLETDRQAYRIEYGNKLRAAGYSEKDIEEALKNMGLGPKNKK